MQQLKDKLGCNAIRCSHNPMSPSMYDACDDLGLLVMDETRHPGDDVETKASTSSPYTHTEHIEKMILRDRNHPSIFMWSIGNEEGWVHTTSIGKRIAQTMLAKQKELDPTRTCTYAADVANVYKGVI